MPVSEQCLKEQHADCSGFATDELGPPRCLCDCHRGLLAPVLVPAPHQRPGQALALCGQL